MTARMSERQKLVRFLAVGGGFSLFYAVVTSVLINSAGAPPFWTSVIVYALCVPAAFLVQKSFTFNATHLRAGAFLYYTGTQVLGVALVSVVTTRFVTHNWWWDTIVMGVTAGLAAILNFLMGRYFTFRGPV